MELISQLLALEPSSQVLGKEPVAPLVILLLVIFIIPILFERIRLPGSVGLLAAGLIFGPHGWNLLHQSPLITLLSEIGLVYLMFVAGLEVDIQQFHRIRNRSLGFGIFTFFVPLLLGIFLGRIFHYNWNAAILIGSLLASYTVLAYPIINRLGVINNEAVNVTIGANTFTDVGALLVLAICVALHTKIYGFWQLIRLFNWLIIYSLVILIGFYWAGKEFFRRSGDDEGNQFLFVLLSVFLTAVGSQLIGVEKILGAFLAGLAVNEAVGEGQVKEKVTFVGNVVFIPIFFVNLGLSIDLSAFVKNIDNLKLTLFIVFSLLVSKFIAALLAKLFYRYNWREILTMWSLSLPQVNVTLAATLVGYRSGLLNTDVFNSIIVLMFVTSGLGPLITSKVAVGLTTLTVKEERLTTPPYQKPEQRDSPVTIVVPVYNPQTQQYLIEMAALLARQAHGRIIPLAIATAFAHMDAPQLDASVQRSERLLAKAKALSRVLGVEAEPLLRIDDAFAQGISRASREQNASLIVMGWGKRTGLRARLFGNVIDNVIWASHCPVAVTRLVESPKKIQRILVPIENLMAPSLQPVYFAQILGEANQALVTVLNVCERRTSSSKIAWRRSQLSLIVSRLAMPNPPEIQIIAHENVAQAILQAARLYDLVVLPFLSNRTSPGGLAISDVTTELARQLTCSIVMLGEPQRTPTPAVLATGVANTTATMSEGIT
ncbi:MAG: cation:proton antiporter [Rhizonema sp. PD38]|nr:cation:proton antiporter [Rhizonema sp. PD38]